MQTSIRFSFRVAAVARKALALILVGALLTPLAASADAPTLDQSSTSAFVGQLTRYLQTATTKEGAERRGATAFLNGVASQCGKSLPGLPPKPPKAVRRTYEDLSGEAEVLLLLVIERPLKQPAAAFSRAIVHLRWHDALIQQEVAAIARQLDQLNSLHRLPHLCADVAAAAKHGFKRVPRDLTRLIRQLRAIDRAGGKTVSEPVLLAKMKPYLTSADRADYNQALKLDSRLEQAELNLVLSSVLRLGHTLSGKPYP